VGGGGRGRRGESRGEKRRENRAGRGSGGRERREGERGEKRAEGRAGRARVLSLWFSFVVLIFSTGRQDDTMPPVTGRHKTPHVAPVLCGLLDRS
jgi:hypothetical protein